MERILGILHAVNLPHSSLLLLWSDLNPGRDLSFPPLFIGWHWNARIDQLLVLPEHALLEHETFSLQEWRFDGGSEPQVSCGSVELHNRESLVVFLVGRGVGDFVLGGFEVPARDDLEGLADVDDEGSRRIFHWLPSRLSGPDMQSGDRDGKEERCGTIICMT